MHSLPQFRRRICSQRGEQKQQTKLRDSVTLRAAEVAEEVAAGCHLTISRLDRAHADWAVKIVLPSMQTEAAWQDPSSRRVTA